MSMQWIKPATLQSILAVALILVSAAAFGQDKSPATTEPSPVAPTTEGVAPKPAKPWVPKYLSDGEPDWSGFWRANPGGDTYDITGGKARPDSLLQGDGTKRPPTHRVTGPPDGKIPYQPWAAARYKELSENIDSPTKPEYVDTQAHCLLEGPGRVFIHSGFEIVQTPGYIVFLTEENDEQVIVPINAGPHIGPDIKLWQGDRRGHWEGNTLVVDVTNVKGKSRLDMSGDFYSPSAHFVERLTRVDDNTIKYEATVTDPAVYTQPWTLNIRFRRAHGDDSHYELWEDACHEGERSADRLVISAEAQKKMQEAQALAQANTNGQKPQQ